MKFTSIFLVILLLAACGEKKKPELTFEQVIQVHTGQSKDEILKLLGPPSVVESTDGPICTEEHWRYVDGEDNVVHIKWKDGKVFGYTVHFKGGVNIHG